MTNNQLKFYSVSSNVSSISSGSYTWTAPEPIPITEEQKIEVTLLDGTKVTMSIKDYVQFTAYNKMIPSDCEDLDEFNEKMMVFRI